jgi:hypothetical protein
VITRLPRYFGGTRPYFICSGDGAAGCGRRVTKMYFLRGRFLCRCCGRLVYTSMYTYQPWQRAFLRANKLQRRLGITGMVVPEIPTGMPAPDYARLLEATLQAEMQVAEACTTRLLQLAAGTGSRCRRKPGRA